MLTHVGVEDHLDDQVAELAEVALLHVGENVAVVLLDQSEKKEEGTVLNQCGFTF